MMTRPLLPLHLLFAIAHAFDLVREHSGTGFFDGFAFYGNYDNLTNGDVNWLNRSAAYTQNLVRINAAQHAVIKVDNSTNVPFNFKRDSLPVWNALGHGPTTYTVRVFGMAGDMDKIGVNWPQDGEIDIIEGVNLMTQNQMALHTQPGCIQTTPPQGQLGRSGPNPDCSQGAGCTVLDTTNKSSFGQAFAQAGGGVWATQFDIAGVFDSIWFWNRADLPASLMAGAPANRLDISSWGTPVASYPSTSCNMSHSFGPQELVIDITLCGDWGGLPQVYPATCSGQAPNNPSPPNPPRTSPTCYPDNVPGPGSPRFDQAYFEISYIRAYTTGGPAPSPGPTAVASDGATTVGPDNEIPNSTPSNSAASGDLNIMSWGIAGMVALTGVIFGGFVV